MEPFAQPPGTPGTEHNHVTVDDVEFRALYKKTRYVVETADGWSLAVTRYRPTPQKFPQPLFGEPMLLVHGFSQNRHAWTSGEFVKNLLFFGLDIHILELRGHANSSIALQHERCAKFNRPLPPDIDYGWNIDSYFLYDVPAAVAGCKRITQRSKIFYCGHSMGGILGYGYAGIHDDLDGLVTIGAPAELGRAALPVRMLASVGVPLAAAIDAAYATSNLPGDIAHASRTIAAKLRGEATPTPVARNHFRFVPVDSWLKTAANALDLAETNPLLSLIAGQVNVLARQDRVASADIKWLLRQGGEREPRGVVEQFARWIRNNELVCYRTGFDYRRSFSKIRVPMAIIFGDRDPLASVDSTRSVYRQAKSEYLLWRPVKGNSHVELTMGHDIRQICYDIKNLVEFARTHRERGPSLPRIR